MYATKPDDNDNLPNRRPPFWQIQICPWLINYALPAKYTRTAVLEPSFWSRITAEAGLKLYTKFQYEPIDAMSLFDKVLLHEVS